MFQIDEDNNGFIELKELGSALEAVGIKMPGYQLRDLMSTFDTSNDGKISMEEFEALYSSQKGMRDIGTKFKKVRGNHTLQMLKENNVSF